MSTLPTAKQKRLDKKARILNEKPRKWWPMILALLGILGAAGLFWGVNSRQNDSAPVAATVAPEDNLASTVTYPIDLFKDGKARHFEYQDGDITIRYFILQSSDGVVRAAFDACDVCWPAGKGYSQEGDMMVCRNCGRKFASIKVNEVQGGCNPAPLERQVQGDTIVIRFDDIRGGRTYFDFSGRS